MTTMTIPTHAAAVRLARRPAEEPLTDSVFEVVDIEVPEPGAGEVLVRNEWMLLGVVMRDLVFAPDDSSLPIPRFEVGETPWALTVGTVARSQSEDLDEGDLVLHRQGWRSWAGGPAKGFARLQRDLLPSPRYFLSQGPTAYRGMVEMADVGPDDTVFVSGAAGGVGSLAGQIARARGAKRVIGSAGSAAKVDYLVNELGFDAGFDYHDGPVLDHLHRLAPDGIDVMFDNVGGAQFEAAVKASAHGARLALCGVLSGQDPVLPLGHAIAKELVLRPFSTSYAPNDVHNWHEQFGRWLKSGEIIFPHTPVRGGPAAAVRALVDLTERRCTGQVLVDLRSPSDQTD